MTLARFEPRIAAGALAVAAVVMVARVNWADAARHAPACEPRVYACEVTRVIDGDTFEARCDLGLGVLRELTVRVAGIDTPEVRGADSERGHAATQATVEWLAGYDNHVELVDVERGKFGRQVMQVFAPGGGTSLVDALTRGGHVK